MINLRNIKNEGFFSQKTNEEKIKFLLQYAILAPSTHNSQPWIFKINNNSCEVYNNPQKEIPIGDKLGRDKYISFGCMLENFITAAKYYNVYDRIINNSKNKDQLVATIYLKNLSNNNSPVKEKKLLLDAILKRSTRRGIFEKNTIPNQLIKNLYKISKSYKDVSLHLVTNTQDILKLADLTGQGMIIAYNNPNFRKEMSGWFVNNLSSKKEGIPGFSINLPTFHSILFPYLVRFFNIGTLVSKLNKRSIASAPLISIITSNNSNSTVWIQVGRLAERVMLELVKEKIYSSITVAAIEMGVLYKDVQKTLKTKEIPQFFFSSGYITPQKRFTERHELEDMIILS